MIVAHHRDDRWRVRAVTRLLWSCAGRLRRGLGRRPWVPLVIMAVGLLGGYLSAEHDSVYHATTVLSVGRTGSSVGSQRLLTRVVAKEADTPVFVTEAARAAHVHVTTNDVTLTTAEGTRGRLNLRITARLDDPLGAERTANAFAAVVQQQAALLPGLATLTDHAYEASSWTTIHAAAIPTRPRARHLISETLLAGAVALVLGCILNALVDLPRRDRPAQGPAPLPDTGVHDIVDGPIAVLAVIPDRSRPATSPTAGLR